MLITLDAPGGVQVKFDLPKNDHITKVIVKNKDWYERRMLDDIYRRTRDTEGGAIAIDVGACFGTHAAWFAAVCGLRVRALEPASDTYEVLCRTIRINALEALITPLNAAAAAYRCRVTPLRPNPANQGASPVKLGNDVDAYPIDDLDLGGDVKLIKIDVEGMEMEVLQGAEATIQKHKPLVYIEVDSAERFVSVEHFMTIMGYKQMGKWNATPTYGWEPQ